VQEDAPVFPTGRGFSLGFEPHLETEVVRASFYKVPLIILQGEEKLEIDRAHPANRSPTA